jgi:hypothetical protein
MEGERPQYSPKQWAKQRRFASGFEGAVDASVLPSRVAQLELFANEEQQHIQREVNRKLWTPRLPNAGDLERKWMHWLRGLARDDSLVVNLKAAAAQYAAALEKCLPAQEWLRINDKTVKVPGCYYVRRPVTPKTNKALFEAAMSLKQEADAAKHRRKKWLAQFLLDGMPVAVSNFKMRVLYLLRQSDGTVERLVKLMNIEGEESKGGVMGDGSILPNDMYAGSEKFRQQVQTMGNFTWGSDGGAGNTELQALQVDVTKALAHREVQLIESVGWYPLPVKKTAGAPGRDVLEGLWVLKGCMITEGKLFRPDDDGVYFHRDVGYVLGKNGRELEYAQGKPDFLPDLTIDRVQFDRSDWEQPVSDSQEQPTSNDLFESGNLIGSFHREICRRMYDTAGGYPGWLGVASMLGFVAQPEIFAHYKSFSAPWVTGQFQSGKTTFAGWLMAFWGLPHLTGGMALLSKQTTAVGIMCQLENYSCVPLWLDEYRYLDLKGSDKEPILRDAYCRQIGSKWTPDGKQRQIQTMVMVSGESTSGDGATRSRYPHILIAEEQRKANHFQWLNDHREYFCLITRELLLRRHEFVPLVMAELGAWMEDEAMNKVPARNKLAHAVAWAAFAATARLLQSHGEEELRDYRRWLMDYVRRASLDVQSEVNVNVYMQDLITAHNAGAVLNHCLRVEVERGAEPGHADRGNWDKVILYLEPHLATASVNKELRKGGSALPLRLRDIRDQLSRMAFWMKTTKGENYQIIKRFGPKGSQVSKPAWGIILDCHPLGRREVSDEDFAAALREPGDPGNGEIGYPGYPQFKDADPRKGPLYSIVEAWLKWEKEHTNP